MKKTAVAAMSTSCLDQYPYPHNVRILRLNIILEGQVYIDGDNLDVGRFQRWMLDNPDKLPKTSPPDRQTMTRFFLSLADEGYEEVIFVAMSSQLSQTFENIRKDMVPLFADRLKIHLFDSKSATFAEGFMAVQAEKCLQHGLTVEQTLAQLTRLRAQNDLMFCVDNLSYLVNNGRLSGASRFVADMFNIKPVLSLTREGQIVAAERIMSTRRAMKALSDRIGNYTRYGKYMIYTVYSGDLTLHDEFSELLRRKNGLKALPAYPISPVAAAHIGPYAVGFGVFWRE